MLPKAARNSIFKYCFQMGSSRFLIGLRFTHVILDCIVVILMIIAAILVNSFISGKYLSNALLVVILCVSPVLIVFCVSFMHSFHKDEVFWQHRGTLLSRYTFLFSYNGNKVDDTIVSVYSDGFSVSNCDIEYLYIRKNKIVSSVLQCDGLHVGFLNNHVLSEFIIDGDPLTLMELYNIMKSCGSNFDDEFALVVSNLNVEGV